MEIEFSEVIAAGFHVHCYLDGYYIARLSDHGEYWNISIGNRACGNAPTRDDAEEVVRMWVARQPTSPAHPRDANSRSA